MKTPTIEELEKTASKWNAKHPVGTAVCPTRDKGDSIPAPCSLLSIPIETVEGIIFDAMESMNKHAATLVPVLNEHKSPEASEAYKSGVYAVSMKLGMLIGLDGIERQKARYAKIEAELKEFFERRASKANAKDQTS